MIYSTLSNQSIFDICLMTSGTLDLLSKVIDGNIASIDAPIYLNTYISWDNSLTTGESNKSVEKQSAVMATSQKSDHIGFDYTLDFNLS